MHLIQLYWLLSYEYHSDITVIKPQHIVIQFLNIPYLLGMIWLVQAKRIFQKNTFFETFPVVVFENLY